MTRSPNYKRVTALLGSRKFFLGVVILLVLQAAWIALSARYPMAFDENVHLGVIRIYSHHILPFLQGQPPGADVFGAVAQDTSYLYHYIMSFPYRLTEFFTHDQAAQVLVLRALNIGLFAWGLVLWRRVLFRSRASAATVNFCLLVFVLIPVVPLLAAQINYDNLLLPLVALAFTWTLDINSKLTKNRRLDGALLLKLSVLCLLTSLIKYAFLPIFLALMAYLGVRSYKTLGGWNKAWKGLYAGLRGIQRRSGLLLGGAVLVSAVLFGQRYGVNLIRYHHPVPSCDKVLTVKQCMAYGPWGRDYRYKAEKTATPRNPIPYTGEWLYGMWLRLFFAVAGPDASFQTRSPLIAPGLSAIAFTAAGIVLVIAYGGRVLKKYDAQLFIVTGAAAALYIAVLWANQFKAYMGTGRPVAINGRYLIPVILPLILLGALAAGEFLSRWKNPLRLKLAVATVALVSLLWGGGALTFVLRSNPAWYWDNGAVRAVNGAVQDAIGPVIPGYRTPGQFLR